MTQHPSILNMLRGHALLAEIVRGSGRVPPGFVLFDHQERLLAELDRVSRIDEFICKYPADVSAVAEARSRQEFDASVSDFEDGVRDVGRGVSADRVTFLKVN